MIEKAGPGDRAQISELVSSSGLPQVGPIDHFFVIKGKEMIGCIGIEKYGDSGLLRSLAVEASHRHLGLGTQLVNRAISHAEDIGIKELYLLTKDAKDFFRRFGFTEITREEANETIKQSSQFRSRSKIAVCMRRKLSAWVRDLREDERHD